MLLDREIKRIVIHCTDTSPEAPIEHILNIFKARGWRVPGYHKIITHTGEVFEAVPINKVANGAAGYNQDSVHIAYVGGRGKNGKPTDTRTLIQKQRINELIKRMLTLFPKAEVVGHCELNPNKACPCYNVKHSYSQWQNDILI